MLGYDEEAPPRVVLPQPTITIPASGRGRPEPGKHYGKGVPFNVRDRLKR